MTNVMKTLAFFLILFVTSFTAAAQVGHVMQGVGAANMSMGGAATANPIDISGALQWNPASISSFETTQAKFDLGIFFSSPELSSTVPVFDNLGNPTGAFVSGTTKDDRGVSPMPSLGVVFADPDSKHTFGFSAFGISGFGVTFPESTTNPINMPQAMGGFGRIESNYTLLQVGVSYAYQLTEQLSVGIEPTIDFATLELAPNPTSDPSLAGYPSTDVTNATGFGAQFGLFFDSGNGLRLGASYKTAQEFSDFEFENTFLDNGTGTNSFTMDYPAILSLGVGYSTDLFDVATDYRYIDYENTDGFSATGWNPTASVKGFGWSSISVISAGVQYKGFDFAPIRLGYTFSENPISSDVAFFNTPATAIIAHAFQVGTTFELNESFAIDALYHYGTSAGETSGQIYNPMFIGMSPPYGAIPGSDVSYSMTTSLFCVGVTYTFGK